MAVEVLPMGVSIAYRNRRRVRNGMPETYLKKLYQVRVTWLGRREFVGRYEYLRGIVKTCGSACHATC